MTSAAIDDRINSAQSMGRFGFILEDADGTELAITENKVELSLLELWRFTL